MASDATAWRVLDEPALARLRAARAAARELAWLQLAETRAQVPATTVLDRVLPGFVLDIDATIVRCHSEKESAAATWKHTFGNYGVCDVPRLWHAQRRDSPRRRPEPHVVSRHHPRRRVDRRSTSVTRLPDAGRAASGSAVMSLTDSRRRG